MILFTCSQPVSAITSQESIGNKRSHPDSSDTLPATLKQKTRQLRRREQYPRRTSLRFNNVPIPADKINGGKIVHPVDTDNIILDICNNTLRLDIGIRGIGRSHVIGKLKQGRSQVIVRFISYRTRKLVFSNKKAQKGDPNGAFITENLTQFRTNLVKKLASLKYNNKINAYWNTDGRVFVKLNANSERALSVTSRILLILNQKSDKVK
ncbi:unnamed protein product [Mytilus coruscus]|uniref:Uncharacterized protein n=1 Tax=Mytilus coruscus TaxID=42192 RepID=A0A6J8DYG9_MYTCO|nr:unnamed protein product [Mytilus coruscus]